MEPFSFGQDFFVLLAAGRGGPAGFAVGCGYLGTIQVVEEFVGQIFAAGFLQDRYAVAVEAVALFGVDEVEIGGVVYGELGAALPELGRRDVS